MITIISSTNREGSYSLKVAQYYKAIIEEKGEATNILDLQDLPKDFIESGLYDNSGKNITFNKLVTIIGECEKFIFIIPEYNGSFPGVLKTFIDGLEYPNTFKGKKVALMGISSGIQGSILAMSHFTDILNYLGATVIPQKVKIPNIENNFIAAKFSNPLHTQVIDEQIDKLIES